MFYSSETHSVYFPSGRTQCHTNGKPLAETSALLETQGINVSQSSCGQISGSFFISSCGAATGEIHLHLIASKDLEQAEALGFLSVKRLTEGYQTQECH